MKRGYTSEAKEQYITVIIFTVEEIRKRAKNIMPLEILS